MWIHHRLVAHELYAINIVHVLNASLPPAPVQAGKKSDN